MLERFDGNWTFRGHANSRTDDSRTCQFADTPIRGLWTIRGKTLSGQAGLFADRLFEVTALPVASSRQAGAHCQVGFRDSYRSPVFSLLGAKVPTRNFRSQERKFP